MIVRDLGGLALVNVEGNFLSHRDIVRILDPAVPFRIRLHVVLEFGGVPADDRVLEELARADGHREDDQEDHRDHVTHPVQSIVVRLPAELSKVWDMSQ